MSAVSAVSAPLLRVECVVSMFAESRVRTFFLTPAEPTVAALAETPKIVDFVKEFKQKYGTEPALIFFTFGATGKVVETGAIDPARIIHLRIERSKAAFSETPPRKKRSRGAVSGTSDEEAQTKLGQVQQERDHLARKVAELEQCNKSLELQMQRSKQTSVPSSHPASLGSPQVVVAPSGSASVDNRSTSFNANRDQYIAGRTDNQGPEARVVAPQSPPPAAAASPDHRQSNRVTVATPSQSSQQRVPLGPLSSNVIRPSPSPGPSKGRGLNVVQQIKLHVTTLDVVTSKLPPNSLIVPPQDMESILHSARSLVEVAEHAKRQ